MAHIVVPAYRFFERLIVTKPGETPPTMGEPFNEPPESVKARKSSNAVGEWDTVNTYSMSFYSMYIDLPTWSVVRIPMSNDMPLSTFWGKSALSICFYDRVAPNSVEKHLPKYNNYGFVVRVSFNTAAICFLYSFALTPLSEDTIPRFCWESFQVATNRRSSPRQR